MDNSHRAGDEPQNAGTHLYTCHAENTKGRFFGFIDCITFIVYEFLALHVNNTMKIAVLHPDLGIGKYAGYKWLNYCVITNC